MVPGPLFLPVWGLLGAESTGDEGDLRLGPVGVPPTRIWNSFRANGLSVSVETGCVFTPHSRFPKRKKKI